MSHFRGSGKARHLPKAIQPENQRPPTKRISSPLLLFQLRLLKQELYSDFICIYTYIYIHIQYLALKMCTAISLTLACKQSGFIWTNEVWVHSGDLGEGTEVSAKEEKENRATWLGCVEACLENTLSSLSPAARNLIWRALFPESSQATCYPSNCQDCFS